MNAKNIFTTLIILAIAAVAGFVLFKDGYKKWNAHSTDTHSESHEGHDHDAHQEEGHDDHEGCDHQAEQMHEAHDDHEHENEKEADEHAECTHEAEEETGEHEEHAHEETEQVVELTHEQIEQIGLKTAVASGGTIDMQITLTGEIKLNTDKTAHIVPRVEGVVVEVKKSLGESVETDEVLAVIESRELADIKSDYIAAVQKLEMTRLAFEREEKLWKDKISSQQEYLDIKQSLTEAEIAKNTAAQKLLAAGFEKEHLGELMKQPSQTLTLFEVRSPVSGEIIDKDIVLGEVVGGDSSIFVIADMNTVWIDLQVYPEDTRHIKKGMEVSMMISPQSPAVKGEISYIGAVADEQTRTVLARVTADNASGLLKPGLFVTADTSVSQTRADVVIAKEAVQTIDGRKCVFIKDEHGFEKSEVRLGAADTGKVQILSGLEAGQTYVTDGAFALKSKIVTSTLDSHAGHGH